MIGLTVPYWLMIAMRRPWASIVNSGWNRPPWKPCSAVSERSAMSRGMNSWKRPKL